MWAPDEFLEQMYQTLAAQRTAAARKGEGSGADRETFAEDAPTRPTEAAHVHAHADMEGAGTRRARLRQRLGLSAFGPLNGPLAPVVLERVTAGDVVRERIEFSTVGGLRMPAYVVVPNGLTPGERLPGVLLWHGHGPGSRTMVGLAGDGWPAAPAGRLGDNVASALARRGLVVMVPEIAGFGDRRLQRDLRRDPNAPNSCFSLSVSLLMAGRTLAGLRVAEAMRAADYLQTRPEVDPERIGSIGYSGGGMVTTLFAALDLRVRAAVVGIYANTFQQSILAMPHCICNYIPGLLEDAELPDILGLIAPRPLFIESGADDPIFPLAGTTEAVARVKEIYRRAGCEDRFDYHIFPGRHEIWGERSFAWLAEQLQS
ncbi:hypothetical protein GCM10010885_07200 [Alicyclobacillus cellulosilyticus]|uniref:Dienelactone hydrolase domain-containing protein n=1 Tax=Alicyclobacillus cellulosilyticus TaxID=1003997 RepID=A0A917NH30_9BACL|nr:dienelactone hydrolase family protein [Alicyclobacillus cellulosilyticus]GGJ00550.1 hypothetical protein GCM10010885_07200 [Alicyclobacillus cellulosilyticus]